ncbi:MAG: hypothetical protein MUE81_09635 [Thermoflexibacter sp.]|jgi:hypothetical protein|nr:hypothetical protein [Thermoflexibacter sp.]
MLTYSETYTYYSYFLFFIFFSYLLGHFILLLTKVKQNTLTIHSRVFSKLFLGILSSVLSYSLLQSLFLTFNIFFLPLIFLFYKEVRYQQFTTNKFSSFLPDKQELRIVLVSITFATIAFLVKVLELTDIQSGYLYHYELTYDKIFYSNLVDVLEDLGQENVEAGLNYMGKQYHGVHAYHYFELWLSALIVKFSGLLSLYTFSLISAVLLLSALFLGYLSIFENFKKNIKWYHYFIAGFLCFSTTIFFDFYQSIELIRYISRRYDMGLIDALSMPKLAISELFLICVFLFFVNGKYHLGVITAFAMPIVNIGLTPCILSGFFIFFALNWRFKLIETNNLKILFSLVLFAIAYFLFAFFLKPTAPRQIPEISILSNIGLSTFFTKALVRIVAEWARFIILYLPFILLTFWLIFKNRHLKIIFFIFLSVLFCGIAFSGLTYFIIDSYQFAQNFAVIYFKVFFVVLPLALWQTKKENTRLKYAFSVLYFLLFVVSIYSFGKRIVYEKKLIYSGVYTEKVSHILKKISKTQHPLTGIILLDKNEMPTVFTFGVLSEPTLGGYIAHTVNHSFLINTSWYKILDVYPDKRLNIFIGNSPFQQFILKQTEAHIQKTPKELLVDFIKEKRISFAVASKNVNIQQEIQDNNLIQEIIRDEKTGEAFILLKIN